jgi:adenylate kinase family enzyme
LAKRLGIPHFDLDEMFWNDPPSGYGKRRGEDERKGLLDAAVKEPNWIIEGVYDKWVFPSFAAADIVIVLRPTLWLRIWRIVRRFVRRKLGIEPRKNEKLSYLIRLIVWSFEYENQHIPDFWQLFGKIRFVLSSAETRKRRFGLFPSNSGKRGPLTTPSVQTPRATFWV